MKAVDIYAKEKPFNDWLNEKPIRLTSIKFLNDGCVFLDVEIPDAPEKVS